MKKQKWKKPKLIVLVRGDGQESVLVTCKQGNQSGSNDSSDMECRNSSCKNCSARSGS